MNCVLASVIVDVFGRMMFSTLFVVAMASLAFKAFDNDGAIGGAAKGAAKRGLLGLIGRWFK